MTLLRLRTARGIKSVDVGLNIGTEADFENGISQSYIATAMQHIIDVLNSKKSKYGLKPVKFLGMFPEFANEHGEELSAEMELPIVVILIRLGGLKEVGIGRGVAGTEDGDAKGFNQSATIEFDCYGDDQNVADRVAGNISLLIQQELFAFIRKGFQNMKTVFSKAAKGWNPNIQWDFEVLWFPFKVQRHIMNVLTYFDVVWVEKEVSYGTITRIEWAVTGETVFEFAIGNSLAYLLVEDIEFNWHKGILV